jgi:hypothetical protein
MSSNVAGEWFGRSERCERDSLYGLTWTPRHGDDDRLRFHGLQRYGFIDGSQFGDRGWIGWNSLVLSAISFSLGVAAQRH